MAHFPPLEGMSFDMDEVLYNNLFECEVEPYDIHDPLDAAHVQFIQAMLEGQRQDTNDIALEMSQDGFAHLIYHILPQNIEMWSIWGSEEGEILLSYAWNFLKTFA